MTTTYSQQGSKLVGSGATAPSAQGSGVSIYDNTLAWGGPQNNTNIGAVFSYTPVDIPSVVDDAEVNLFPCW